MTKDEFPAFYPIMDTAILARNGLSPVEMAKVLADANAGIAQFRHKGPYTRDVFEQAETACQILRDAGTLTVINDRADVARMLGADGVHLGQDDLPPSAVRSMVGESMLLGFSTHNKDQLLEGNQLPVDYLALGPIFPTGSKDKPDPVVGLAKLKDLCALTSKPLVAIGGITRTNARQALEYGADSVAVLSDVCRADLRQRVHQWNDLVKETA